MTTSSNNSKISLKKIKVKVNDLKYDRRFEYFESRPIPNPTGLVYYYRVTKTWWKSMMWLGQKIKNIVYKIDKIFPQEYIDYQGKTATANPYVRKYYSGILWWVRKYMTYD